MLYMSGGGTDTIKKYWTASRAAEATAKPRCDSATPSTMPMHGQQAMRKLACHTITLFQKSIFCPLGPKFDGPIFKVFST